MDKGLKYVGTNPIKGMALGLQAGHKLYLGGTLIWEDPIIEFDDEAVKAICVNNWGGHLVSGEITESEAAKVTSLADKFKGNTSITAFEELEYFIGLTMLSEQFRGCTNLTKVKIPKAPNLITLSMAFYQCSKLESVVVPNDQNWTFNSYGLYRTFYLCNKLAGEIDLSSVKSISSTYVNCERLFQGTKVTQVVMPRTKVALNYAFNSATELTYIDTNGMDASIVGATTDILRQCTSLATITHGFSGIKVGFDASACPLTHDSAVAIINGLAAVPNTQILKFKSTTYDTLTADEIAIAQNKNWQIA